MNVPTKPWVLWSHDPCPEGGWGIYGEFDTKEEAIEAAKRHHEEWEERHRRMVDHHMKDPLPDGTPWTWACECYDGCMVTPSSVFGIYTPKE
jgi:hypothetical protein